MHSDHQNRFAFLVKSIEVFITAGLFLAAFVIFSSVTSGLFEALGIHLSDVIHRLLTAGGSGTIPVLAVANIYAPQLSPVAQDFEKGLSILISTLMRLLLPLALLVLIIYLCVIPFNFMAPFHNRQLLIVYNVMLFAIMGLLIDITPVHENQLFSKYQGALQKGILALAILATLVSVYALSATVYRTVQDIITPNRLTVIGWNTINIGILTLLIYKQFKYGPERWIQSIQSTLSTGAIAYIAWTIFLIVAIPLLFH